MSLDCSTRGAFARYTCPMAPLPSFDSSRYSSKAPGGPASAVILDELRMGYTWRDVVPQGPPPETVPTLQISRAVKLSWQSDLTTFYQPQISYDMSNWFDLGSTITGTGNTISIFDSTDLDAKKSYRVQIH